MQIINLPHLCPNVINRPIGYSVEVAVKDIIDNNNVAEIQANYLIYPDSDYSCETEVKHGVNF